MPVRVPRYSQQIKESEFADDYDLDSETIREIERLLQEWATATSWIAEARADAGRHAKREIEALAKTLDKLPDQWHAAFFNHYLQQHIIEAYCGCMDEVDGLVRSVNQLEALAAEFSQLKDAINKVKSMEEWRSWVFPQVREGRPSGRANKKLIDGLDALATRRGIPDKNDFIRRAAEFVSLRWTRKTLRNIRSRSRK